MWPSKVNRSHYFFIVIFVPHIFYYCFIINYKCKIVHLLATKINIRQFNKYVFVSFTVLNLYISVVNIGFTTFDK